MKEELFANLIHNGAKTSSMVHSNFCSSTIPTDMRWYWILVNSKMNKNIHATSERFCSPLCTYCSISGISWRIIYMNCSFNTIYLIANLVWQKEAWGGENFDLLKKWGNCPELGGWEFCNLEKRIGKKVCWKTFNLALDVWPWREAPLLDMIFQIDRAITSKLTSDNLMRDSSHKYNFVFDFLV